VYYFIPSVLSGASPTFFQTVEQSVCGQSLVMRISWVPDYVLSIVCNVSYICLLYVCKDSVLPCNGTYTASIAYHLRYSSAGGILSLKGGLLLCDSRSQVHIHSDVTILDP